MQQEHASPPILYDLSSGLDLTISLDALVEDPALLDQPIEMEPEEIERLDALANEYLSELQQQGRIPEAPPMDIDPKLLEPAQQRDLDFGR